MSEWLSTWIEKAIDSFYNKDASLPKSARAQIIQFNRVPNGEQSTAEALVSDRRMYAKVLFKTQAIDEFEKLQSDSTEYTLCDIKGGLIILKDYQVVPHVDYPKGVWEHLLIINKFSFYANEKSSQFGTQLINSGTYPPFQVKIKRHFQLQQIVKLLQDNYNRKTLTLKENKSIDSKAVVSSIIARHEFAFIPEEQQRLLDELPEWTSDFHLPSSSGTSESADVSLPSNQCDVMPSVTAHSSDKGVDISGDRLVYPHDDSPLTPSPPPKHTNSDILEVLEKNQSDSLMQLLDQETSESANLYDGSSPSNHVHQSDVMASFSSDLSDDVSDNKPRGRSPHTSLSNLALLDVLENLEQKSAMNSKRPKQSEGDIVEERLGMHGKVGGEGRGEGRLSLETSLTRQLQQHNVWLGRCRTAQLSFENSSFSGQIFEGKELEVDASMCVSSLDSESEACCQSQCVGTKGKTSILQRYQNNGEIDFQDASDLCNGSMESIAEGDEVEIEVHDSTRASEVLTAMMKIHGIKVKTHQSGDKKSKSKNLAEGGRRVSFAEGGSHVRRESPTEGGPHGQRGSPAERGPHGRPKSLAEGGLHGRPKSPAEGSPHGQPKSPAEGGPHGRPKSPAEGGPHGRPKSPAEGGPHGRPKSPAEGGPHKSPTESPTESPTVESVPTSLSDASSAGFKSDESFSILRDVSYTDLTPNHFDPGFASTASDSAVPKQKTVTFDKSLISIFSSESSDEMFEDTLVPCTQMDEYKVESFRDPLQLFEPAKSTSDNTRTKPAKVKLKGTSQNSSQSLQFSLSDSQLVQGLNENTSLFSDVAKRRPSVKSSQIKSRLSIETSSRKTEGILPTHSERVVNMTSVASNYRRFQKSRDISMSKRKETFTINTSVTMETSNHDTGVIRNSSLRVANVIANANVTDTTNQETPDSTTTTTPSLTAGDGSTEVSTDDPTDCRVRPGTMKRKLPAQDYEETPTLRKKLFTPVSSGNSIPEIDKKRFIEGPTKHLNINDTPVHLSCGNVLYSQQEPLVLELTSSSEVTSSQEVISDVLVSPILIPSPLYNTEEKDSGEARHKHNDTPQSHTELQSNKSVEEGLSTPDEILTFSSPTFLSLPSYQIPNAEINIEHPAISREGEKTLEKRKEDILLDPRTQRNICHALSPVLSDSESDDDYQSSFCWFTADSWH